MKKIKNYLEDNNYKTAEGKTKWHVSSIERILRRRTYMGEYEYMQSVTIDSLTHERVNQNDKSRRVTKAGNFPAIIEPELWFKVQEIIDSRINHYLTVGNGKPVMKGIAVNKDIYCRKMRCGCGRRFKKDNGRIDGTGTYRCYALIDDGGQATRIERSKILNDDCCINGIIDWKLDLFTLKVFDYLSYNSEEIKNQVIKIVNKVYVSSSKTGNSYEDKLKLENEIKHLEAKSERLLDALTDGVISKEDYQKKKKEIHNLTDSVQVELKELERDNIVEDEKEKTIEEVRKFIDNSLRFPRLGNNILSVPEKYIDVFVNSIKACANNVFEYNIRVNPYADIESPLVVPDEEYIPSVHSATKKLDNSKAVLLTEFEVDYATAKEYASHLRRKVIRVHWQIPAKIRIYVNL